ncbi:DUF47 family protein [Rothia sp. P6271]|uniref:DUF47 family protein n=1 Tax=unclassified Rothia (in: high G+C Gram-positive bacteria) TaxID=2689056 RepID=UPI003AD24E2C
MFDYLFLSENSSLKSLAELSRKVINSADMLSELVGSIEQADTSNILDEMFTQEAQAQDLFFTTMTLVRSSFAAPLPREDLYTLANHLMTAVERLTSAAHVLSLHRIDRFPSHLTTMLDLIQREAVLTTAVIPKLEDLKGLDEYWIDMLRISRQATRTAEIYSAELVDQNNSQHYMKHFQFITELKAVSDSMRAVSAQIGRIVVQES